MLSAARGSIPEKTSSQKPNTEVKLSPGNDLSSIFAQMPAYESDEGLDDREVWVFGIIETSYQKLEANMESLEPVAWGMLAYFQVNLRSFVVFCSCACLIVSSLLVKRRDTDVFRFFRHSVSVQSLLPSILTRLATAEMPR